MLRGRETGLTFVEMVIAIALMSLVILTFYAVIGVAVREWAAVEGQVEVQQQPRIALARIAGETRQARDFVIAAGGRSLGLVKATVLLQDAAPGATALEVEDASMLAPGMPLVIQSLTRLERATVTAIAGTSVTLSGGTARLHRRGEAVRRAQTSLAGPAFAGSPSFAVADGTVLRAGDLVAVGDEGPLDVLTVTGNVVALGAALAQAHPDGEVVQPLSVMFQCEGACLDPGAQVTRCTTACGTPANRIPLADFLAAPAPRPLFGAVAGTLAAPAPAGATSVCLSNPPAGFQTEDRIRVGREVHGPAGADLPERRRIVTASGGCLTLDRGLVRGHAAGTVVRVDAVVLTARAFRSNDAVGGQVQEVIVTTTVGLRN